MGFNLGGVYELSERWDWLFSAGREFQGENRLTAFYGGTGIPGGAGSGSFLWFPLDHRP